MSSLLIQRFISQYGNLASRYDYVSATGTMDKQILFYLSLIGIVVGISLIVISSIKRKSKYVDLGGQPGEYATESVGEYATESGGEPVGEYATESGGEPVGEPVGVPIGGRVNKTERRSLLQKILLVIGIIVLLSSSTGAGYYGFIYFAKYLPQYKEWHSRLPRNAIRDLSIINGVSTINSFK